LDELEVPVGQVILDLKFDVWYLRSCAIARDEVMGADLIMRLRPHAMDGTLSLSEVSFKTLEDNVLHLHAFKKTLKSLYGTKRTP
jgi:hypothetical protein